MHVLGTVQNKLVGSEETLCLRAKLTYPINENNSNSYYSTVVYSEFHLNNSISRYSSEIHCSFFQFLQYITTTSTIIIKQFWFSIIKLTLNLLLPTH